MYFLLSDFLTHTHTHTHTHMHTHTQLADKVGHHICLLKTHVDMMTDFTRSTAEKLSQLAAQHNFIIMEDRSGGTGATPLFMHASQCEKAVFQYMHELLYKPP